MMQISPPPTEQKLGERGFTLIEMLVVLTIVALIAVVGAATLQRKPSSLARQRAAIQIKLLTEGARQQAISSGQPAILDLSKISAANGTLALDGAWGGPEAHIAFYPDGSSTGGTVMFDEQPLVRVNWLTGQIDDARS